jgi:hypothetical protein
MRVRHIACAALVGVSGCAGEVGTEEPSSTTTQASSTNPYVFLVLMENHNASQIYGDTSSAPYINGTLLPKYAHATNYTTTVHPSEPNYVWLEAGSNNTGDHTFTTDNDPSSTNSTGTTSHLVTQLKNAGHTWRSYQEGINSTTGACPVVSAGGSPEFYAAKHDPFVFFRDVSGNPPSKSNTFCSSHIKPLSSMAGDITAGNVASYTFVTPNLCNDMHGASGCPSNLILTGDTWLKNNLPQMISWVDAHGGVVLVVWDEGSSGSNGPMPMIAAGPHVKAGHAGTVAYTHSSTLKSVEEIFGVPLLRHAADSGTNDLKDLFVSGFFP